MKRFWDIFLPFTNKVTYFRDKKFGLLKVNSDCDGERDSYDAMVLLTGRLDLTDVPGFYEKTNNISHQFDYVTLKQDVEFHVVEEISQRHSQLLV